ncbi:Leucyl aminopeptidase (aminopeptidase T) [Rubrobacter radiotolerans]|uniref:Aminopeptidase n=1 Tax=Rubrobacter radiotolerans TaxID=42256 RepID=A0A023X1U7_RUBRA|nr:aminopeptidase [Rubrobacter radiotolerans]AHY46442.1 Leucyl aminopeptidase (aminopeptidase T) [Rubrobacter radiotolerans]MDX5893849.1 aminopeptidase [Rubrobacter radiotolerans]SMC04614.1 Leucyl aminopeptidase (aminopeptidase T) [Rubrobacter radiotolerans DSM 5868]
MHDPRLDKLARLLVDYSLAPEEGHNVVVSGGVAATPLIKSVYARLLQVGAVPFTQVALPGMQELYFKNARDEHYETTPKLTRRVYEEADGFVSIMAPTNTRALAGVDPAKQQAVGKRDRELSDLVLSRDRWILTLFPTEALAQESDMSLDDYAEFAFEAMALNRDDPVAFWKAKSEEQEKLKERLEEADEIRIVGPRTELTLSVAGRTFINSAGRHNMPCGEVFTGPVEDSANGHVFFDVPAAAGGRDVSGVFLRFENGRVVEASAEKGQDYLQAMLDADAGARYLGELGIGTNYGIPRATRSILFDEKLGGTVHLAVGRSYETTGGKNESSVHWDLITDLRQGGEIYADGELIQRDGRFVGFDIGNDASGEAGAA